MSEITKKSLVGALKTTADLLDLLGVGDDPFRAQAFRSAARSLESVQDEIAVLESREFAGIPKVGRAIAVDLLAYVRTGVFGPLEDAASLIPAGVLSLFRVRGLGPKKIRALWDAGIDSLEVLREACRDGRVAGLGGFGAKSAASFLAAVEFALSAQERQHLSTALEVAEGLCRRLEGLSPEIAGDVRRGLDTVRTSRVTVTATPQQVQERLAGVVEGLTPVDPKPLFAGRVDGVPVEIAYAPTPGIRGALDLMMGGSTAYRESLREGAKAKGFDFSGRGLKRGFQILDTPTEADAMRLLDLPLRPAEYREPEHDALWDTLPPPDQLVKVSDLRGMLHTHSTWSDGASSIADMAAETVRLGHDFLGTGDHSRAAHYANGLSIERLQAQLKEVRELQAAGVPLVAGAEVDILDDGSLDYPDDVLAELEYVVASVHSLFTLDAARQTERLIRAATHPLVTILGHPTGRLLLRRPGYALDMDAVMNACAANGTVVEINANAYRLDIDWRIALTWRDRVTFAINTDAHVTGGLKDSKYGVLVARKAGLTPQHVVNTLGQEAFLEFVKNQRAGR